MGRNVKIFRDGKEHPDKRTQLFTTVRIRNMINEIVIWKSHRDKRNYTRDEILMEMIELYIEANNIKDSADEVFKEAIEEVMKR